MGEVILAAIGGLILGSVGGYFLFLKNHEDDNDDPTGEKKQKLYDGIVRIRQQVQQIVNP